MCRYLGLVFCPKHILVRILVVYKIGLQSIDIIHYRHVARCALHHMPIDGHFESEKDEIQYMQVKKEHFVKIKPQFVFRFIYNTCAKNFVM